MIPTFLPSHGTPTWIFSLAIFAFVSAPVFSQDAMTPEIAGRYEQMVERSPRPGAAFDRIIDYYSTTGGGLEALRERWQGVVALAEENEEASQAHRILLGMLAERMRDPQAARSAYQDALAAAVSDTDILAAARLLAALETTEGNFAEAAEAWEKALAVKNLAPTDQMDLFRSLALLHQRAFAEDEAVAVWKRALQAFPDDSFVLEEAGEAFLAAGDFEEAMTAFKKLRDDAESDPFRRVAASMRLAHASDVAGDAEAAIGIYLELLEETSEGSWIQREVRSRIENHFRRKDDLPGLVACYETRLETEARDYLTLAALSSVLEELGQIEDAVNRLRTASELAPGQSELRLQLARLLNRTGDREEAISVATELAKPAAAGVEVHRLLGSLWWSAWLESKNPEDRAKAIEAWHKIASNESQEAGRIVLLAEVLENHDLVEPAIEQWMRLVELVDHAPDARQRLAELHLKLEDESTAKGQIAAIAKAGTPEAMLAASRLQERFGWNEEADETLTRALQKFPNDFEVRNAAFRSAADAGDREAVEEHFPIVWGQAPNAFFADEYVKRYVRFLSDEEILGGEVLRRSQAMDEAEPTLLDCKVLLALAIVNDDEELAKRAIEGFQSLNDAMAAARAQADFAAAFGTTSDQVAALKAIATLDPRFAVDSLRQAARIEANGGDFDEALVTLDEAISRSPADAQLVREYADFAASAGRMEEGVARLREAIRHVEDGTSLRMQLADLHLAQGQLDQAEQILQDAWENESGEGRRKQIFRRQIEVAMASGKLEDLIASLRERQSRERDGSRYGAYLAEIFLMQNDFVSARDELMRGLGTNPSDPEAAKTLLELSERAGDQAEALRLSGRLVEIAPTSENQAAHLNRLLATGSLPEALEMIATLRSEITSDPVVWAGSVESIRSAGLVELSDQLIDQMLAVASDDASIRFAIAKLRLAQREFGAAEKILWDLVKDPAFGDAFEKVFTSSQGTRSVVMGGMGTGTRNSGMTRLQQIKNEVQQSLQQSLQAHHHARHIHLNRFGGIFGTARMLPTPSADPSSPTAAQQDLVRAAFLLHALQLARQDDSMFFDEMQQVFDAVGSTPAQQLSFWLSLGRHEGLPELWMQYVEEGESDRNLDAMLLSHKEQDNSELQAPAKARQKQLESEQSSFATEHKVKELAASFPGGGETLSTEEQQELKEKLVALWESEEAKKSTSALGLLAIGAVHAGDLELSKEILEAAESIAAGASNPRIFQHPQAMPMRFYGPRSAILNILIHTNPEAAIEWFEEMVATMNSTSPSGPMASGPFGIGMSRGSGHPLLMDSMQLRVGDREFPIMLFSSMLRSIAGGQTGQEFLDEIEARANGETLQVWDVVLAYFDWTSGRQDEAIRRVVEIHENNPTPRTGTLLFEMYEAAQKPDEALAVLDLAELQLGETRDVRALRKLKLLRKAGRTEEARAEAERLVKTRLSSALRGPLTKELNELGIAPPANLAPAHHRTSRRPAQTRAQVLTDQINKLVGEQKIEMATRIATDQLRGPLPVRNDYDTMNLRSNLIRSLRSMEQLEDWRKELKTKLEQDPGDVASALRLIETLESSKDSAERESLLSLIHNNFERITDLGTILQVLQRSGNTAQIQSEFILGLLEREPSKLGRQGFDLFEHSNMVRDEESRSRLGQQIAEMPDASWDALSFPDRLMGAGRSLHLLGELAEFCASQGNPQTAAKLLQRSLASSTHTINSPQVLQATLRLTELQLAMDQKDAAAETLRHWIQHSTQRTGPLGVQSAALSSVLQQFVGQSGGGGSQTEQLERVALLAEKTGTLDELLALLEEESGRADVMLPSTIGLVMKTSVGREGLGEEWKKLAESGAVQSGIMNPGIATTIIKALAENSDTKQFIPAFLKKNPIQPMHFGGDLSLRALVELLPVFADFQDDAEVNGFVDRMVQLTLTSPHGAQHLIHNPIYTKAIRALLDTGRSDHARKLFEFTDTVRQGNPNNNVQVLADLERRFLAEDGELDTLVVVLAPQPSSSLSTVVRWQINPWSSETAGTFNSRNNSGPAWEGRPLPVSKARLPAKLEILAGSSPANLEVVATVPGPKSEGEVKCKLPGTLGLLQPRWTLKDGSVHWGPLGAFVIGKNLVVNPVLAKDPAIFREGLFSKAGPGPGGGDTAVQLSDLSAGNQISIPIAKVPTRDFKGAFVFAGWTSGGEDSPNLPYPEIKWLDSNGRPQSRRAHFNASSANHWTRIIQVYGIEEDMGFGTMRFDGSDLDVSLVFQAWRGVNSLYQKVGAWDALQVVLLPADEVDARINEPLNEVRTLQREGKLDQALPLWFDLLRRNPESTLSSSGANLVSAAKEAGRLDELFEILAAPALYMPNPLRNRNPAFRNIELIGELADLALEPEAPPGAGLWLKNLRTVGIDDTHKLTIEVAAWVADPVGEFNASEQEEQAGAALALLGIRDDNFDKERLNQIWSNAGDSSPVLRWLATVKARGLTETILARLEPMVVPVEQRLGTRFLEAWLLLDSDPEKALNIWREVTMGRRTVPNSVNFNDRFNHRFLQTVARTHPSPGVVHSFAQAGFAQASSDPSYAHRQMLELIYPITTWHRESVEANPEFQKRKSEYVLLWLDLELAGLANLQISPQRNRVRDAAQMLIELEDWDRLGRLLNLVENHSRLQSTDLRAEFSALRKLHALAQGDFQSAWPVAWLSETGENGTMHAHWQWNIREVDPRNGIFDSAIAVADSPVMKTIPNQERIELWFGALPSKMEKIQEVLGADAQGSTEISLPGEVGFLRAVSVVGTERVAGPVVPVVSGRRIFPPEGESMQAFFDSGTRPLEGAKLVKNGVTPGGDPAFRIDPTSGSSRPTFFGVACPVEPGKFYIQRIWLRRTGSGDASIYAEYQSSDGNSRPLSMILADGQRSTGQWVLYTRAIPTFPAHTFWIPYQTVESVVPKFQNIINGTEFGGWEMLEVEGWEYGDWMRDLAILRQSALDRATDSDPAPALTEEEFANALELAAVEPLTAMDYHGQWLLEQGAALDQAASVLELFRSALTAEANPLFARPKLNRIFRALKNFVNHEAIQVDMKRDAAELGIEQSWQSSPLVTLELYSGLLNLARDNEKAAVRTRIRTALQNQLDRWKDNDTAADTIPKSEFYQAAAKTGWRHSQPHNELASLLEALEDSELHPAILESISESNLLPENQRILLVAVLNAIPPKASSKPDLFDQVRPVIEGSGSSSIDSNHAMLILILADLLERHQNDTKSARHLRMALLKRLESDKNPSPDSIRIGLRTATSSAIAAMANGENESLRNLIDTIENILNTHRPKNETYRLDSMLILAELVQALQKQGHPDLAKRIVELTHLDAEQYPEIISVYGSIQDTSGQD